MEEEGLSPKDPIRGRRKGKGKKTNSMSTLEKKERNQRKQVGWV